MSLAVFAAAFGSVSASAETVTLGTTACGTLKQCIDIPNDAGLSISLYGAPQYPWFFVYIDGVQYRAPVASGFVMDNVEAQAADGSLLTISGTFSYYRTCTRSGRGQSCLLQWSLLGGTLVR